MTGRVRLPLRIGVAPYLMDHRIEGKAVFPAAEALNVLADAVRAYLPESRLRWMVQASFPRFLPIGPEESRIEAFHEIERHENGDRVSRLLTMSVSRSGRIGRAKEHAAVRFRGEAPDIPALPFEEASRLEGKVFRIAPERLYRELIPFGLSYRNVLDETLVLTEAGAVAQISAGSVARAFGVLGSPFPMDAALHCACVWGQRYAGVVAFPVGFAERVVFHPAVTGETCFVRVIPAGMQDRALIFDLWIYGLDGAPRETLLGVAMKDVTAGRMKPPDWVRARPCGD
jgi:hypothetical protein